MDFTWLFLVFIIISMLQPIIRQKILEANRVKMFRALEEKRGSRVIALIHRQERLSFLGFPVARYIEINDSEEVLRAIRLTDPQVPIDLILHTPGGLVRCRVDRPGSLPPSSQGNGIRSALCHVWRDADRTGCRRDRHG
jgi:hypothetical protein